MSLFLRLIYRELKVLSLLETLTLAIALGTDAFSVAIVCGVQQFKTKSIIQISLIIAAFHIIMPLTGFYGGRFIQDLLISIFNLKGSIDRVFNIIGAGLLLLIGIYMVLEKWLDTRDDICNFKLSGWGMIVLAFSVSIDSLSIGISLGMLGDITLLVVLVIGSTAGLMMGTGLYFGSKLGHFLGEEAQFLGGIVLIFLGLHFAGFI
ncbi:manganese efflux pump [Iocasia frigidifontis]|uniref:Putative manganese efflux pump MntP n=1 Tax=Iocasia fonsfrigidae TaxID=2682810 RepID=A0A8A7KG63_9FIRM|nr:manganese efflux pump [Iocasia fonsfrigidae]